MVGKFFLITVVFALASAIPQISGFSFKRSDLAFPEVVHGLESMLQKEHPELFAWYDKIALRVFTNAEAEPEDLKEIRGVLTGFRNEVYNFVNSPLYNPTTTQYIEIAVRSVTPLLQIVPINEYHNLVNIIKNDPKLAAYVTEIKEEYEKETVEEQVEELFKVVLGKGVLLAYSALQDFNLSL